MNTPLQFHSIFICYRRGDSLDLVGRIYDHLAHHFGESAIFRDMESIAAGRDFAQTIDAALAAAKVGVVIIGPKWMELLHSHRNDHQDYVGLECEEMLRKANFRTVTCCLNDARMPSPNDLPPSLHKLTYIQACNVRSDRSFKADVNHLIEVIEATLAEVERQTASVKTPPRVPVSASPVSASQPAPAKSKTWVPVVATLGAVFALVVIGLIVAVFMFATPNKETAAKDQAATAPSSTSAVVASKIVPPKTSEPPTESDVPSVGSVVSSKASDSAAEEEPGKTPSTKKEADSFGLWKHNR